MVLKWPFAGDTGKDMTLHVHCSALTGDRALIQCDSFIGMMVLKRPLIGDTGENCSAYSLFRSLGDRAFSQSDSFNEKIVLKRKFIETELVELI